MGDFLCVQMTTTVGKKIAHTFNIPENTQNTKKSEKHETFTLGEFFSASGMSDEAARMKTLKY